MNTYAILCARDLFNMSTFQVNSLANLNPFTRVVAAIRWHWPRFCDAMQC